MIQEELEDESESSITVESLESINLSCYDGAEEGGYTSPLIAAEMGIDHLTLTSTTSSTSYHDITHRGHTALMLAAMHGHSEIVEHILDQISSSEERRHLIMAVDDEGRTALHWAAMYGESGIVHQLMEAGADTRAMNRLFCTPLDYAARLKNSGGLLEMMKQGNVAVASSVDGPVVHTLHTE